MAAERLVRTEVLDDASTRNLLAQPEFRMFFDRAQGTLVLEHERIWFPSYPYEWPAEMLHAAGCLTVELARALLAEGLGLKDGTPYNVLFRGPNAVFIDVLSCEPRRDGDSTWLPYAQFVRTFLLPLVAGKYLGLSPGAVLSSRRDGLEPGEVYRWLKAHQRLRPLILSLVSIPAWLARKHDPDDTALYKKRHAGSPEKARFVLGSLYSSLERALARLAPAPDRRSAWSGYLDSNNNYSAEHFAAKESFVTKALAEIAPRRVLDVGANTGHFSALAARSGASVVAIDSDAVVVGAIWRKARVEKLEILPLVVDLTRPTPGIGWRNQECPSFLDRARGSFDCVLMLAVVHHMLVTERVPLAEILALAAELTTRFAIIEFIGPDDSMFRRLVRGREELHASLGVRSFEDACRPHFEILRSEHVGGTQRWLYLLRRTG